MPLPEYPTPRKSSKPFDPSILDSTVIAIPLLNAIQSEMKMIQWAEKKKPELLEQFNFAFLYDPEFPGGVKAAYSSALELLAEARKRVPREEITPVLESPKKEGTHLYSVARIDSRLRRKLLALNADLPERPILRIVPALYEVIVDLNLDFPKGRDEARNWVSKNVLDAKAAVPGADRDEEQRVHEEKSHYSNQYVFARLEGRVLQKLVELDAENAKRLAENAQQKAVEESKSKAAAEDPGTAAREELLSPRAIETQAAFNPARFRAIYHIWPDFRITPCIIKSVATVKADAAMTSFSANGTDVTWAVMDSGINADHAHFTFHGNIDAASNLHADFTSTDDVPKDKDPALIDRYGHGTHVAGIIAGEQHADGPAGTSATMRAVVRWVEGYQAGDAPKINSKIVKLAAIRGMAPRCRLVSLKVLDEKIPYCRPRPPPPRRSVPRCKPLWIELVAQRDIHPVNEQLPAVRVLLLNMRNSRDEAAHFACRWHPPYAPRQDPPSQSAGSQTHPAQPGRPRACRSILSLFGCSPSIPAQRTPPACQASWRVFHRPLPRLPCRPRLLSPRPR
jgi:hypothetical protein